MIYILMKITGDYEDYSEYPMLASLDKRSLEHYISENRLDKKRKSSYEIIEVEQLIVNE